MKITSQFRFGPNLAKGGGGLQRFGNIPNFYRFLVLIASLSHNTGEYRCRGIPGLGMGTVMSQQVADGDPH